MTNITIQQATLAYAGQPLFKALNFCLPSKQCVAILGPSGVGKSSLLRFIAGLLEATHHKKEASIISGKVFADDAQPIHHRLSFLAQTDALLPWLTVTNNVMIGSSLRKESKNTQKCQQLLAAVGLSKAQNKYPRQLSGGMRQRVALARTLYEDKPIVLMDEPFAALDIVTKLQLQTLTANLLKDRTRLLVTHDPMEALRLADHIYLLAGHPATLTKVLTLNTSAPRAPDSVDLLEKQSLLIKQLLQAKEAQT